MTIKKSLLAFSFSTCVFLPGISETTLAGGSLRIPIADRFTAEPPTKKQFELLEAEYTRQYQSDEFWSSFTFDFLGQVVIKPTIPDLRGKFPYGQELAGYTIDLAKSYNDDVNLELRRNLVMNQLNAWKKKNGGSLIAITKDNVDVEIVEDILDIFKDVEPEIRLDIHDDLLDTAFKIIKDNRGRISQLEDAVAKLNMTAGQTQTEAKAILKIKKEQKKLDKAKATFEKKRKVTREDIKYYGQVMQANGSALQTLFPSHTGMHKIGIAMSGAGSALVLSSTLSGPAAILPIAAVGFNTINSLGGGGGADPNRLIMKQIEALANLMKALHKETITEIRDVKDQVWIGNTLIQAASSAASKSCINLIPPNYHQSDFLYVGNYRINLVDSIYADILNDGYLEDENMKNCLSGLSEMFPTKQKDTIDPALHLLSQNSADPGGKELENYIKHFITPMNQLLAKIDTSVLYVMSRPSTSYAHLTNKMGRLDKVPASPRFQAPTSKTRADSVSLILYVSFLASLHHLYNYSNYKAGGAPDGVSKFARARLASGLEATQAGLINEAAIAGDAQLYLIRSILENNWTQASEYLKSEAYDTDAKKLALRKLVDNLYSQNPYWAANLLRLKLYELIDTDLKLRMYRISRQSMVWRSWFEHELVFPYQIVGGDSAVFANVYGTKVPMPSVEEIKSRGLHVTAETISLIQLAARLEDEIFGYDIFDEEGLGADSGLLEAATRLSVYGPWPSIITLGKPGT